MQPRPEQGQQLTELVELSEGDLTLEIELAMPLMPRIVDDLMIVFDGCSVDFSIPKAAPRLMPIQEGSPLFQQGAQLGDLLVGVRRPENKLLSRSKSVAEAAVVLGGATALTLRRVAKPKPAVSDPRNVDGKLRVKVYPKAVYPYPARYQ